MIGASITGSSHQIKGLKNQDAFACAKRNGVKVSVVCDGCSSSPNADLGAKFIAENLADIFLDRILKSIGENISLNRKSEREKISRDCRKKILKLIEQSSPDGTDKELTCFDYIMDVFLATAMVGVITNDHVWLSTCGDGVYFIDDEFTLINEGRAPNYLAYELIKSGIDKSVNLNTNFKERIYRPISKITLFGFGSDGYGNIHDFMIADETAINYFSNIRESSELANDFNQVAVASALAYDDVTLLFECFSASS